MKLCRFTHGHAGVRVGAMSDDSTVHDLTPAGVDRLSAILEREDPAGAAAELIARGMPRVPVADVTFHAPVDQQEVWAAGVTYLRSKTARMEESDFSATAYDRVYDAERPEIFFKSTPEKVVGPNELVGIRRDSKWNVPEPELALVMNSYGTIVGCTIGNDMSSRDIEGENLLYLPQAKIYHRACALGPWIVLGFPGDKARKWTIGVEIRRHDTAVFSGETSISQIKRRFDDLAKYLFRSQVFAHGAVLLTGTGVVPDDTFTLQANDVVRITVSGIGTLENAVTLV